MPRYIDNETRQEILSVVHMTQQEESIENILNGIPEVDVALVVHAHWVAIGIDYDMPICFRCSRCRQHAIRKGEFCPNCGAKMEEEVKNDAVH